MSENAVEYEDIEVSKAIIEEVYSNNEISPDSSLWDTYVNLRNLFIFQIIEKAGDEPTNVSEILKTIEDIRDYKIIESSYLENFELSLRLVFNQQTSMSIEQIKEKLQIIDKGCKPDYRISGWKYYDNYLAAFWTFYLYKKLEVKEARSMYFCSKLFSVSETTIRRTSNDLKIRNVYENKVEPLVFDIIMLITNIRLCEIETKLDKIEPRSKTNLRSIDAIKEVIDVFRKFRNNYTIEAIKSIKDLLKSQPKFVSQAFDEGEVSDLIELTKNPKNIIINNTESLLLIYFKIANSICPWALDLDFIKYTTAYEPGSNVVA